MPGLLSRMFRRKAAASDAKLAKKLNRSATSVNGNSHAVYSDPWEKTWVRREDVVDLLKVCCDELKARGYYPCFFGELPLNLQVLIRRYSYYRFDLRAI